MAEPKREKSKSGETHNIWNSSKPMRRKQPPAVDPLDFTDIPLMSKAKKTNGWMFTPPIYGLCNGRLSREQTKRKDTQASQKHSITSITNRCPNGRITLCASDIMRRNISSVSRHNFVTSVSHSKPSSKVYYKRDKLWSEHPVVPPSLQTRNSNSRPPTI